MTESELIDTVLSEAAECSACLTSGNADDYRKALQKAKNYGLIEKQGVCYCLTKPGQIAVDMGGFDKWLLHDKKEQENAAKPTYSISGGNAIFGDNNSGNNQGRDLDVFPNAQPIGNPTTNPPAIETKDSSKMSLSVPQFIAWLMATFIGGVGIGFTICNSLKH